MENEKEIDMKTAEAKPKMQTKPAQPGALQKRVEANLALRDQMEQAQHLVKSGLLPKEIDTPEKALVIMQMGRELGMAPMKAFRSIYVVYGKPALSAQLMRALVEASGLCEKFKVVEASAQQCRIQVKRKGRDEREFSFTLEDAKRLFGNAFASKDNWHKQPTVMLEWRATSKACRHEFPEVVLGLYTPEEIAEEVELQEVKAEPEAAQDAGTESPMLSPAAALEAVPVPAQTKMHDPAIEGPQDVSDVKIKPDDMSDETIMRYAMPAGKYKGMSLTKVYFQKTAAGKPVGKIYLRDIAADPKTGAAVKQIIERFLALMEKEEAASK